MSATITDADRETARLAVLSYMSQMTLPEQVADLQRRVAALEGGQPTGYVCVCCHARQPANHFWYSARNVDTSKVVQPVCAPCVRGAAADVCGASWRHGGPFKQPVS